MKVLFVDGTGGFSPLRLTTKPTGGIITSLTLIPQYLAAQGHEVVVGSEYEGPKEGNQRLRGVEYIRELRESDRQSDVVVFNRNIYNHAFLDQFSKRSRLVWWLHDIVDYRFMEDDSYLRMDQIVALSDYCVASYADFFGIGRDRFTVIPNGVDKALFKPNDAHNRKLFVCASATIKGLYPMHFTWANLKRCVPDAELRIYSSQSLHDKEDTSQAKGQLKALEEAGAQVLAPIPQAELAEVFRAARAVLMPNHYPEICSNILLQAQACGTPVVATDIGSANEYITNYETGLLTQTKPHDMFWWHKDYAQLTLKIATDNMLYDAIHAKAPGKVYDWKEIGEKWNGLVSFL